MQPDFFIGVDCGVSGAIENSDRHNNVEIHDMPIVPKAGKFNRHDPVKIFNILSVRGSKYNCNTIAVVEHVHFDWRDDAKKGSAEVLIRSHESILTALAIAGIETHDLEVPVWRKLAGCQGMSDEQAIVEYAIQLFPAVRGQLKRRSTRAKAGYVFEHNRAEALMMAFAAKKIAIKEELAC